MNTETILSLAGVIISALSGAVAFLYREVRRLTKELLAEREERLRQALESAAKAEAARDSTAQSMLPISQMLKLMYAKIVTAQKKSKS